MIILIKIIIIVDVSHQCSCRSVHVVWSINALINALLFVVNCYPKQPNKKQIWRKRRFHRLPYTYAEFIIIYFNSFFFFQQKKNTVETDRLWQNLISYIYMRTLITSSFSSFLFSSVEFALLLVIASHKMKIYGFFLYLDLQSLILFILLLMFNL